VPTHSPPGLDDAIALRDAGRLDDALTRFSELVARYPDDAGVAYHAAWAHDARGLEAQAVPLYERALDLGLEGDDARGALLGLGSTYRTLGRYDEAERVLSSGITDHPGERDIEVFYAMALYNAGKPKDACELLLRLLADTTSDPSISAYRRAILLYAHDLDRTWT
jgi:tetratricopeptide (TPR) repeat protein